MTRYISKNSFVVIFLAIWSAYFASLAILRLSSLYAELDRAILYDFLFVALVALPPALLPLPAMRSQSNNKNYLMAVMVLGIVISAMAVLCLAIDKAKLGIDYHKGICLAREQMTHLGQFRKGINSPYSFVGNLFGLAFFASIIVVLTQNVSRLVFWTVTLISFALLMAFSAVAASRSPIMLFGAVCVGMVCFRLITNSRLPKLTMVDVLGGIGVVAIAAMFILSMFECRAVSSHMSELQYRDSFVEYLGAKLEPHKTEGSENGKIVDQAPPNGKLLDQVTGEVHAYLDKARGLVGLTALYFAHSAFTFAAILSAPPEHARILFVHAQQLLSRLGLVEPPETQWELAGRFASLPGGLWHDFGLVGMCFGAAILGLAAWGALCAARVFSASMVLAGVASPVFAVAFLSPIHFAGEFAQFPFVCFCLVAIPGLAYLLIRCWNTGSPPLERTVSSESC